MRHFECLGLGSIPNRTVKVLNFFKGSKPIYVEYKVCDYFSGEKMPYKDKKKRKEYQKKWYAKNRKKEIASANERKKKYKVKVRDFIVKDKISKGCAKCDEIEPCCLDYHHIKDNKETAIAKVLNKGWGQKRITEEIKKCIVVCSNCHRKLHANLIVL